MKCSVKQRQLETKNMNELAQLERDVDELRRTVYGNGGDEPPPTVRKALISDF